MLKFSGYKTNLFISNKPQKVETLDLDRKG